MPVTATRRRKATRKKARGMNRVTDANRLAEMQSFVEICFSVLTAEGKTTKEIANIANMSKSTVRRYELGKATLRSWYGTVQSLGYAAGLKLTHTELGYRVLLLNQ